MAQQYLSPKYQEKVRIVRAFLTANLATELEAFVLKEYGVEKGGFFSRLCTDQLTDADVASINEKLGTLSHLRDSRTSFEYALDLVMGWIMEDALRPMLEGFGYTVALSSADKEREFLKRPKASPDYIVTNPKSGTTCRIELVKDYTGYWKKTKKIQLRDNKFMNLAKEHGYLLGIDFANESFFILKIEEGAARYLPMHFLWKKPAYEMDLMLENFSPLTTMRVVLERDLK